MKINWYTVCFVCGIALLTLVALFIGIDKAQGFTSGVSHCPDGWTVKYQEPWTINVKGATVEFANPKTFCVKAGTKNSGIITGKKFTVNWTNNGGQVPDISYVVIYDGVPTGTFTPTNTDEPLPTPTDTLEPTPTNTLEVTPSDTVE